MPPSNKSSGVSDIVRLLGSISRRQMDMKQEIEQQGVKIDEILAMLKKQREIIEKEFKL